MDRDLRSGRFSLPGSIQEMQRLIRWSMEAGLLSTNFQGCAVLPYIKSKASVFFVARFIRVVHMSQVRDILNLHLPSALSP